MTANKSMKPNAKVMAGLTGGTGYSAIVGLVTALTTGDWLTVLTVIGMSFAPVLIQFGLAWYKLDPERKALLERFEAELNKEKGPDSAEG